MTFEELQKANAAITTVNIKGKEYSPVQERITAFRKVMPDGFIKTELVSVQDGICIMRAEVGICVMREGGFYDMVLGTGTAYEKETSSYINKTSYIENCETSAVGRALGMAGFGIDSSVASFEEVANAIQNQNSSQTAQNAQKPPKRSKAQGSSPEPEKAVSGPSGGLQSKISAHEWEVLKQMCKDKNIDPQEVLERYGYQKPSEVTLAMYDDMIKALQEGKL